MIFTVVLFLLGAECRRHVRLPVHEALHSRRVLPATSRQFLPASAQRLLRPLRPVPAPRVLVERAESLWHLQRVVAPDERQLPSSLKVPRLRSGLLFTLLSRRSKRSQRSTLTFDIYVFFSILFLTWTLKWGCNCSWRGNQDAFCWQTDLKSVVLKTSEQYYPLTVINFFRKSKAKQLLD